MKIPDQNFTSSTSFSTFCEWIGNAFWPPHFPNLLRLGPLTAVDYVFSYCTRIFTWHFHSSSFRPPCRCLIYEPPQCLFVSNNMCDEITQDNDSYIVPTLGYTLLDVLILPRWYFQEYHSPSSCLTMYLSSPEDFLLIIVAQSTWTRSGSWPTALNVSIDNAIKFIHASSASSWLWYGDTKLAKTQLSKWLQNPDTTLKFWHHRRSFLGMPSPRYPTGIKSFLQSGDSLT